MEMKIRNGFVSNSSSSSFLLALGKVKDPTAFIKHIRDVDFFGIDVVSFTEEVLKGHQDPLYPFESKRNSDGKILFYLESFLGDKLYISSENLKPNDMVAYMAVFGVHDDNDFEDEYGNVDYNVELYFYEYEPSLEFFKNNKQTEEMMTNVSYITGAGYNG